MARMIETIIDRKPAKKAQRIRRAQKTRYTSQRGEASENRVGMMKILANRVQMAKRIAIMSLDTWSLTAALKKDIKKPSPVLFL
jgi:hypothetical protein